MNVILNKQINPKQHFKVLKEAVQDIQDKQYKREEFKELIYKFRSGQMGVYHKIEYCLSNIIEFIEHIRRHEAKNL